MSCTVTIKNYAGPAVFTILVANGQPAGKGKVVYSEAINSRDPRRSALSHPLMMIGISAKQYDLDEVVGLDVLTGAARIECSGQQITAEWKDNRFSLTYFRD